MTFKEGLTTAKDRLLLMQQAAVPSVSTATFSDKIGNIRPPFWYNVVRVTSSQSTSLDEYVYEVTFRALLIAGKRDEDVEGAIENRIQFEYAPDFIDYFHARKSLQLASTDSVPRWLYVDGVRLGAGGGYGFIEDNFVGFEIPIILPFRVYVENLFY